jgi:hypothetical protein
VPFDRLADVAEDVGWDTVELAAVLPGCDGETKDYPEHELGDDHNERSCEPGVALGAEAAAHAAAAFATEGRQDSARRSAARSRELRPTEQGADRRPIDDAAIELTPREAQMVEPAARGLTTTEIVDRLVLSKQTVETTFTARCASWALTTGASFGPRTSWSRHRLCGS